MYDDADEERFLRSQRMIRHRFAKMARRRAMWERDPNVWSWTRSTKSLDKVERASSNASNHMQKPQKEEQSAARDPGVSFYKDFDSFRKAVDRAIERDPYGTLFGRRLWSPPSSMSWTSFSWFADPKDMKDTSKDCSQSSPTAGVGAPAETFKATATGSQASGSPTAQHSSLHPDINSTGVYVYDPIVGRKVLQSNSDHSTSRTPFYSNPTGNATMKSTVEPSPSTSQDRNTAADSKYTPDGPRKSIFETLFGENNAVDIPVKVYEPKVYGHGGNATQKEAMANAKPATKPAFENSRKREFQALRAATLGNTIDTTAEFYGKYEKDGEALHLKQTSVQGKADSSESANLPPFTGTTYEGRAAGILTGNKSHWLEQEGFVGLEESLPRSSNGPKSKTQKLQPALDRVSSGNTEDSKILQPALERGPKVKNVNRLDKEDSKGDAWQKRQDAVEKAEDIDLLRSSDVRMRSRTRAQGLKQDLETKRKAMREDLEKSFSVAQSQKDSIKKPDTAARRDSLWQHLSSHPEGVVARTIKSINAGLQAFGASATSPGTKDLEARPHAVDLKSAAASGSKTQPARYAVQHVANTETQRASDPILPAEEKKSSGEVATANDHARPRPHPLSNATIKEGVSRDPLIERHTMEFEPRYADLVHEVKDVRRVLHHSFNELRALRSSMERRPWNELEAERLNEYARVPLVEEDNAAASFDEPVYSAKKAPVAKPDAAPATASETQQGTHKRDTDPKGLDEPVLLHMIPTQKPVENKKKQDLATPVTRVEPPVFTPAGSKAWNDEQLPPMAELKEAGKQQFTSPFVMLINNGKNGVRAVPAPNLPHLARGQTVKPFEILAALEQTKAAQFVAYFPRLQEAGYALVGGDLNKLTFRKIPPAESEKKAATVLDEIPAEVDPPGPSAPIAPPSSSSHISDRAVNKRQPRIRRQEEVFSGTTTATFRPAVTATTKSASAAAADPPRDFEQTFESKQQNKEGLFTRLTRTLRRVTLTVIALAAGTYTIGLISEGVGAQAQAQHTIGDAAGPRKRIVMPVEDGKQRASGTRPGIYSTENSR